VSSRSNSPFRLPAHPISTTVRTSWSGSSRRSGRGTHSSRSMRMSNQHLFGEFERCDSLLAAHTGKMVEEHIQCLASFEIVQQRFHRHRLTHKDRGTPQDVRITVDHRWLPWHMSPPCRRDTTPDDDGWQEPTAEPQPPLEARQLGGDKARSQQTC